MATILLQVPFFKHVFGWIGGHTAGEGPSPLGMDSVYHKCGLRTLVSVSALQLGERGFCAFPRTAHLVCGQWQVATELAVYGKSTALNNPGLFAQTATPLGGY